jgi:Ca-activated chloride channel family protein
MRFGQTNYFHLLWLVIPLILLYVWSLRKRRQLIHQFCSPELLAKLTTPKSRTKQNVKSTLVIFAVILIIIALTHPRWGYQWEELRQEGIDLIIAVDVSASMLAEDIKPNRLTRAKHKVADLLNMLEGDRVGLVAFAGTSFLQCPLTLDYSAATLFLNAIDTDLIPVPGTAIAHAIHTSIKAFSTREKKSKAIIMITDGEDQEGKALEAAQEAKEQGIKIYVIGVGQESGAPIPNPAGGGFKKDRKGEVILSKLDEPSLKQIALATGGTYVHSVTGDMDLNKIYLEDIKQTIEKKELKTARRQLWQERFQWFVFAALMCLILEPLVREK